MHEKSSSCLFHLCESLPSEYVAKVLKSVTECFEYSKKYQQFGRTRDYLLLYFCVAEAYENKIKKPNQHAITYLVFRWYVL